MEKRFINNNNVNLYRAITLGGHHYMVKWKLFRRFRSKEEGKPEYEESTEVETEETLQTETEQEPEKPTAVEYHETLYSEDTPSKKGKKNKRKINRTIWRDIRGVEEKVDEIHITRGRKPVTELDKRIDRITSTIELEEIDTHRKPSNVIYVVNRPQPGQVRGDWAVRGHGKIYSQHRTKEKAIKAARKIAKEKNATVMVQNTDGTFSEGFKPRQ